MSASASPQMIGSGQGRKSTIQITIDRLSTDRDNFLIQAREITEQIGVLVQAQALISGERLPQQATENGTVRTLTSELVYDLTNDWSGFPKSSVKGLNKIETIKELARYVGGTINDLRDLASVVMDLGLTDKKTVTAASAWLYGSVISSRDFKKLGPRKFKLVE